MQAGEYGITAEEIIAAGAMKFYLQSMEPAEALKKVAAVYIGNGWRCGCKGN